MSVNTITLIGIGLTFIASVINIIIGIINNRKTIYINSVTKLRSEWLYRIKEYLAEFVEESYKYVLADKYINNGNVDSYAKLKKIRSLIFLNFNYSDKIDQKIIDDMDELIGLIKTASSTDKISQSLDKLIRNSARLAKFEWEGIKLESEKGKVSKKSKDKLKEKHLLQNER